MPNTSDQPKFCIMIVPAERIVPFNRLSSRTRRRCETALTEWYKGNYDHLVVSGGVYETRRTQSVSAGQLMSGWFRARRFPRRCLVPETKARDSFENIKNSVAILVNRGAHTDYRRWEVTVVTDPWHARRFRVSFRQMYGIEINIVPVNYPMSLIDRLKELAFYLVHLLEPRGNGLFGRLNRWLRSRAVPTI